MVSGKTQRSHLKIDHRARVMNETLFAKIDKSFDLQELEDFTYL
jgi:hypothetical protein